MPVLVVGWMTSHWDHGPVLLYLDPPNWNSVCHWEGPLSQGEIDGWIAATLTREFGYFHEFLEHTVLHGP